jgi:hypothetical protein
MTDQRSDNRMVRLATLWKRTSKAGNTYFSGFMGDCQSLMFRGEEITRENGEVVQTWNLLVQDRDRPAQRQQPRACDHDLPTGGTEVHRHPRPRDPREERVAELAAAFDARGPDDVPW